MTLIQPSSPCRANFLTLGAPGSGSAPGNARHGRHLLPRNLPPGATEAPASPGSGLGSTRAATFSPQPDVPPPAATDAHCVAAAGNGSNGPSRDIAAALAAATSEDSARVQAAVSWLVPRLCSAGVNEALQAIPKGSPQEVRLLAAFTNALAGDNGELPDDAALEAMAVWLLQRGDWEAICEPRLFDKLQLMMSSRVALAFIRAESRDAAAARRATPAVFAGIADGEIIMEQILARRRNQMWDSFLQVHSHEILLTAVAEEDFARIALLLPYAPEGGARQMVQTLFEALGPNDGILPALRRFCATQNIEVPCALRARPETPDQEYLEALLQWVNRRGHLPRDMDYFWSTLKACDTSTREALLLADTEATAAGELALALSASPVARVVETFAPESLARLLDARPQSFARSLMSFGADFATWLLDNASTAQLDKLVHVNDFAAVRDLLEMGQWALLGRIVQRTGGSVREQVLTLLREPLPARDFAGDPGGGDADFETAGSSELPTVYATPR